MRTTRVVLVFAFAFALACEARAQVIFELPLPLLRFKVEPPTVVLVPGVRVVPAYDEEIFVADRAWWLRRGEVWYRAPNHRGGWVVVDEHARVPARLRDLPGRYKHYKPGQRHPAELPRQKPGPGRGKVHKR